MERMRNLLASGTLIGDEVFDLNNEHVGKREHLLWC